MHKKLRSVKNQRGRERERKSAKSETKKRVQKSKLEELPLGARKCKRKALKKAHAQLCYKVVPGLVTSGNSPIECFPEYEKLLERRPELVEEVNIMKGSHEHSKTIRNSRY